MGQGRKASSEQGELIRGNAASALEGCLEQLRWYLWGLRSGGIDGWQRMAAKPVQQEQSSGSGADAMDKLSRISEELHGCTRCRLHSGRTNLVFGEGSAQSGLVFVGEGPGFDEDRQGRPFVGRAGKLLDKMIFAIGLERAEVYICNVVKCRPPENRTPQADEAATCSAFLFRQLEALCPKVICALGLSAAQALLGTTRPISQLRGKVQLWRGIPLVCTYHPAYLLRTPTRKASAWQDLQEVMRLLGGGAARHG